MYCNQCGNPNPDNSKFCSSCGQPIQKIEMKTSAEPQPVKSAEPQPVKQTQPKQEANAPRVSDNTDKATAQKDSYQKRVETKEAFSSRFCVAWRNFMTSPLVLATLITYTLFAVVILLGAATVTDALFEIDGIFFNFDNTDGLYFVLFIAIIAPVILFGAGLWMIFYDAYDQSSRPINITGLQIIKGTLVGVLSVSCFMLFISFIASLATDDLSFSFVDYDSVMSVVILVALVTVFYVFTFKLLNNIMGIAEYCIPDVSYLVGYAIAILVAAGLELVVMLSNGFNIIMLLSCAVLIMFGIALLYFRELMSTLKAQAPQSHY